MDGSTPTSAATARIVIASYPRSLSSFLAADKIAARVGAEREVNAIAHNCMPTHVARASLEERPLELLPWEISRSRCERNHRSLQCQQVLAYDCSECR